MTGWSSSHFLQSLGWAILNSIWQMALLWILYLAIQHFFRLKAAHKFQASLISIFTGFAWFLFTFFYYLQTSPVAPVALFTGSIEATNSLLRITLLSASIAYLGLLIFPAYKLYRNWRFVQTIKKSGLSKAGLNYRLFVQRIAGHLGITKKVMVYASELVKSPVTVGYLKPVILIPVAALNNLSTQQVEAILLHELSHIRRFDYLLNFLLSIVNTILYFNPFVKQFMKNIEEERENCCDELVLQFGYDKIGYASALLTLEKLSTQHQVLALCATGKNYLLSRVEKIVGMEKKKGFRMNHLAGLLAAFFCIVIFNSVLIIQEKKNVHFNMAYDDMGAAFNFFNKEDAYQNHSTVPTRQPSEKQSFAALTPPPAPSELTPSTISISLYGEQTMEQPDVNAEQPNHFMQVAQNDIDASLSKEEKEKVKSAMEATRKIITTLQWKEMDKAIGDAMTDSEKQRAREEYLKSFDQQAQMKNLEQNLKAQYEKLNWEQINSNVNKALASIQLDSMEIVLSKALVQLEKANAEACVNGKVTVAPLPDQSVKEVRRSAELLRNQVECIQQARQPKKVVKL